MHTTTYDTVQQTNMTCYNTTHVTTRHDTTVAVRRRQVPLPVFVHLLLAWDYLSRVAVAVGIFGFRFGFSRSDRVDRRRTTYNDKGLALTRVKLRLTISRHGRAILQITHWSGHLQIKSARHLATESTSTCRLVDPRRPQRRPHAHMVNCV